MVSKICEIDREMTKNTEYCNFWRHKYKKYKFFIDAYVHNSLLYFTCMTCRINIVLSSYQLT